MANKKVSQLTSKPSVLVTDLFPIADPTTGQLFKTTISDLGTAIGSGVSSVNTLVGAVVLDTDDIQELASPTNKWFTDTRARAALSASSPLVYNSGTGAFSIPAATTSVNGYLTSTDWTTFNAKQAALSGTGFVKISGTTISYDNSTYLTTSAAASTYLALSGGTLTGALNGTSANFSGDLTLTGTNPRFYLTDSDNNPDYFISNTDGTFTIYDVTNSVSRLTINSTTATLGANLTATSLIKSGGTSSQFLKADGSVDSTAYVSGSGATGRYAIWTGTGVISDGFIQTTSNITYVEGMGLSTLNGIEINGNFGSGSGTAGLKIKSYDETTGKAFIEFINTSGVFRLGIESSTGGSILPGSTAYATVLTSGLTAKNLELGTNNTKRLTIDGTTGAVTLTSTISATGATLTGALSGTSATFNGATQDAIQTVMRLAGKNASSQVKALDFKLTAGTPQWLISTAADGTDAGINIMPNGTAGLSLAFSTGAATFSSSVTATQFNASIATSGAVASVPNLAYFKNQGSGYVARIAIGEGTTSDSYISHTGGNTTATQLLGFGVNDYNQMVLTGAGNVGIGRTNPNMRLEVINSGAAQGTTLFATDNAVNNSLLVYAVSQDLFNTAGTAMILGRNSSTTRSINAGGTINSLGTDYAEYMTKSISESILKGDIVGIDKNGLLTNIFLDSNSFVIKSTNPSFVGGDAWASVDDIGKINNDSTEEEKQIHNAKIEKARAKVDRIAFSGQVPCNVLNAKVGDYIIPINDNGKIKGIAVSNPSFEQYQISVGKVWKIMEDGRAWVAVKIG